MALKLESFKRQTVTNAATPRVYSDLHLDIVEDTSQSNTILRDIRADYDLAAIKNSLTNLFNTVPGQKLLNPVYGLDLSRFLFEPITSAAGRLIGDTILSGLNKFEPRVSVVQIQVKGYPDDNQYTIDLIISVPSLNIKQLTINGILNDTGYTVS